MRWLHAESSLTQEVCAAVLRPSSEGTTTGRVMPLTAGTQEDKGDGAEEYED